MKTFYRGLLSALLLVITSPSSAQTSLEQIRQMLGKPVVIPEAALFAASFGTFKGLCTRPLENAGIFELITRIEFGSLSAEEQNTYKSIMTGQYRSNEDIWNSLADKSAEGEFCRGLESTMIQRSAEFVKAHPQLFAKKAPEKTAAVRTVEEEVHHLLKTNSKVQRLYVYLKADNRILEDIEKIFMHPGNESGANFVWVLKVCAVEYAYMMKITETDFAELGKSYGQIAKIYSKLIRGEIDFEKFKIEVKGAIKSKQAVYTHYLSVLQSQEPAPSTEELEQLHTLAIKIGEMVIGQAKFASAN